MSLSSALGDILHQITNPNNEIRSESEANYNELLSQKPFEVVASLLDIISSNPSANEAYACLILIKNYLNVKKIVELISTQLEFISQIKITIMSFCHDSRFPKKANQFLLMILQTFYIIQLTPQIQNVFPFPDFPPFMISLLDHETFRSNALETLISPYFKESFQVFYKDILAKIDLKCEDMEYRTQSFAFYVNCVQFIEDDNQSYLDILINQMPDIFSTMPDKYFHESISFVFHYYHDKNFQNLSVLFPPFFYLILPRIVHEEIDETIRANYIFDIICMLSSTAFFSFLCNETNQVQFIEALIICSSNPILYPNLYSECRKCIKKMYKDYFFSPYNKIQYNLDHFIECTKHENFFVSSLFSRYFTDMAILPIGVNFASVPDSNNHSNILIRHNGLKQIRRTIKYNQFEDNGKLQLFAFLYQLYLASHDDKIIKVLSQWTRSSSKELRTVVSSHIIELCQQTITTPLIACATLYCSELDQGNSVILANRLLEATLELLKINPCNITDLFCELYLVSHFAGVESSFLFLNQITQIILNMPEAFTNKYIALIISNIAENSKQEQGVLTALSQLGNSIFHKLLELIFELIPQSSDNLLDEGGITNLCFSFNRIPFYSSFIENFEQTALSDVLKFINQVIYSSDFRIEAYALKCLKKLILQYQQNENLISQSIDIFNRSLSECKLIYLFRALMKLFDDIINSPIVQSFNAEKMATLIEIYPKLTEKVFKSIISIQTRDDRITNEDFLDISFSIKQLITIMNSLYRINQVETTKMIIGILSDDFFSTNFPILNQYLLSLLTGLLLFGDFNQIQHIITQVIEKLFELIMDDLNKNNSQLQINAITNLVMFMIDHETSSEIIDSLIGNILAPILQKESVFLTIENRFSDQRLAQVAISSFIIILSKYLSKISNVANCLSLLNDSIVLLTQLNAPTTQSLMNLIQMCLREQTTILLAQKMLQQIESIIKHQQIEPRALSFLYKILNQSKDHGPYQPLFMSIVTILQQTQSIEQ